MQVKVLKYLGRVFRCPIKFLDASQLSEEVLECVDTGSNKDILLVQVIDNSQAKKGLKYSSWNPLQFYALGQDDCDDKLILSGPVEFTSMVDEANAISADGSLVKQSNQIDVLTDLKEF